MFPKEAKIHREAKIHLEAKIHFNETKFHLLMWNLVLKEQGG